ncbi:MAG: urease accessory protein UreD [Ferruginibacter sp.]
MKAHLHIEAKKHGHQTVLGNCFVNTPYKIANITEDKNAGWLELMLMSASPGILDGDVFTQLFDLDENTSLRLHTQAYQRLFTMKQDAQQEMVVNMKTHARFSYLPHPVVPHANSNFTAINNFYLSHHCCLLFGEILTCGRKLNEEVFQFKKFRNLTQIFLNNQLVIRENLWIEPEKINLAAIGQLEGFTHQASLIYLNENCSFEILQPKIDALLQDEPNMEYGVSSTPIPGLLVRMLAQKAEQLHDCMKRIAAILPQNP